MDRTINSIQTCTAQVERLCRECMSTYVTIEEEFAARRQAQQAGLVTGAREAAHRRYLERAGEMNDLVRRAEEVLVRGVRLFNAPSAGPRMEDVAGVIRFNERMDMLELLQDRVEYLRHCAERLIALLSRALGIPLEQRAQSAPVVDIKALPKVVVDQAILLKGDVLSCIICLEELRLRDELIVLPCSHMMWHSACIGKWIEEKGNCPYCRKGLPGYRISRGER